MMVDPVVLAIVVVLVSALGAALFLLGGKEKKKAPAVTGTDGKDRKSPTPNNQQAQTAVASAEPVVDALDEKPVSEVVWEEVEGLKVVEVHEDEIDAEDEEYHKEEPKPKGRLMDRDEAHARHEEWESRNASRNASTCNSPVGSMRLDKNEILLADQSIPVVQDEEPAAVPTPEEAQPELVDVQGNQEEVQQFEETELEPSEDRGVEDGSQDHRQRQSSVGSIDGNRESAQYEENDFVDEGSPRPSEVCGEGRSSLSLDVASLQTTTESTPRSASRPNSLQRHDSKAQNRTVSPMRSPLTRQLSTAGSHYQYKRGGDSWIKSTTIEASAAAASPVSVTPVRHSLPKKIIPVADEQQPLALRSGQKINEYERGVLAEKEKVSSRLQETRLKNITDVVARVLLDGDVAEVPAEIDPTQILTNPNIDVRKKAIVKQMAMKFGAGAAGDGGSAGGGACESASGSAGVLESPRGLEPHQLQQEGGSEGPGETAVQAVQPVRREASSES